MVKATVVLDDTSLGKGVWRGYEMKLKFGEPIPKNRNRKNPLIVAYGEGPPGKRCADCAHLLFYKQSRAWYKCAKRVNTSSPKTDHGKTWRACGAFEQQFWLAKKG